MLKIGCCFSRDLQYAATLHGMQYETDAGTVAIGKRSGLDMHHKPKTKMTIDILICPFPDPFHQWLVALPVAVNVSPLLTAGRRLRAQEKNLLLLLRLC